MYRHRQPRDDAIARRLRAWVWLHQFELDRQLADGRDPGTSPALQARAQAIATERFRRRLVEELRSALAKADHPPSWHSATLPVCAQHVRAARPQLDALAVALQGDGAPPIRGIALAACLIHDPEGPLYRREAGGEIAALAARTVALLSGQPA